MTLDLSQATDDELADILRQIQQERRRRRIAATAKRPRSKAQKDGRVGTALTRAGSTALVPGISLFPRNTGQTIVWTVRASAQVNVMGEKKQQYRSWGLTEHGLKNAIAEACKWRFRHATSGFLTADAMAGAALAQAQADKELIRQLRSQGIKT